MKRNSEHIRSVLDRIGDIWERHTDKSLGVLLDDAVYTEGFIIYRYTDDEIVELLEEWDRKIS